MAEITIETLIEEHKNRIPLLVRDGYYYKYPDMDAYRNWLAKTKRLIASKFPEDKDIDVFERTCSQKLTPEQQKTLLAILEAFVALPAIIPARKAKQATTKMELESPAINVTTNINNSNSQTQSQEQSLAIEIFIEAIKDDLTGKQIKELKAVVAEADNDLEKARPSIIEKLKSFGSDVASNIVANILTNPAIWSGL